MKKLLFLDTETTGLEEEDQLIQIAYKSKYESINELFKPEIPIKYTAMAVHHITETAVKYKPRFKQSLIHEKLNKYNEENWILVAHNAEFDQKMLQKENIEFKQIIDTYKIINELDEEATLESYQLQYLRYYFNLEVQGPAHDAASDIIVLEALFHKLKEWLITKEQLDEDQVINRMINISNKPIYIKKFTFGKYKGQFIKDVATNDKQYLQWLYKQKQTETQDQKNWIYTLKQHI